MKLDQLTKRYNIAQNKILKVEFIKGGEGYIQRKELKALIDINVKVFHGNRQNHVFQVSIADKIEVIFDKLKQIDEKEM